MVSDSELWRFVAESNRIEGILRKPTLHEISATRSFLELKAPLVEDVEGLERSR